MIPARPHGMRAPRGTATALLIHHYRSQVMSIMKTKLKFVAVAVLLGTATVATAQTPSRAPTFGAVAAADSTAAQTPSRAQTFADQLQQYQNISSTTAGTYTFHPAPTF